jgi:hypothetical protein
MKPKFAKKTAAKSQKNILIGCVKVPVLVIRNPDATVFLSRGTRHVVTVISSHSRAYERNI